MKKILILGGGFAGLETYRRLHQMLHPAQKKDIHIELINRTNYFTFTPMLHEAATGSVSREHLVQPLRESIVCCGKDFHEATVKQIDPDSRHVHTDKGSHEYDVLVVALGVDQGWFGVPSAHQYAVPLKRLNDAIIIRNKIISSFERASEMHDQDNIRAMEDSLHFIIVGGGPSGVELAGQMSDMIKNEMRQFYGDVPSHLVKITLVHAGDRLLPQLSPWASAKALKRLKELGATTLLNAQVSEVTADGVQIKDGKFLTGKNIFWTAGTQSALSNMLPADLLDERGLLKTTPTMQLEKYPEVFAIGDCSVAIDSKYNYPPLAQAAVQSADLFFAKQAALHASLPAQGRHYPDRRLVWNLRKKALTLARVICMAAAPGCVFGYDVRLG